MHTRIVHIVVNWFPFNLQQIAPRPVGNHGSLIFPGHFRPNPPKSSAVSKPAWMLRSRMMGLFLESAEILPNFAMWLRFRVTLRAAVSRPHAPSHSKVKCAEKKRNLSATNKTCAPCAMNGGPKGRGTSRAGVRAAPPHPTRSGELHPCRDESEKVCTRGSA
jgi:hypothetical protein